MVIKRWRSKTRHFSYRVMEVLYMKKFSLDMIKNKKHKIVSSEEALKDVQPFDWKNAKEK